MIAIANEESTWDLFTDELVPVATVEGANMRRVRVEGNSLIGDVTAVWGATKIAGSIPLGKPFDHRTYQPLWFDFDGLHDAVHTTVDTLHRVLLLNGEISGRIADAQSCR